MCLLVFVFAWVGLRLYLRYLLFSVGGLLVFFDVLSLFKSSTRVPVFFVLFPCLSTLSLPTPFQHWKFVSWVYYLTIRRMEQSIL